jgi:Domain of unknown function (DUF1833)
MARNYSANFKSTLAEVNAPESPLILLEIDHPELSQPVRVVNDSDDVNSNGNLYIAFPFRCVLPDDFESQIPKARLSIANVGRELMYWIETTAGGQGSTCTFKQILRSNPNLIEWEITMNLYNVNVTMQEISAELGFENLFSKPAISRQYRPDTASGLF